MKRLLAILLHHLGWMTVCVEEQFSVVVTEDIVNIDADKDTNLLDIVQFLAQFEVTGRTKIANNGVENVEVGHIGSDAVEFVHQRRLYIIEKLGAHDTLGVFWHFCLSKVSQRKLSVKLSDVPEDLLDYLLPCKKAHG